jgi:hypothetical protein
MQMQTHANNTLHCTDACSRHPYPCTPTYACCSFIVPCCLSSIVTPCGNVTMLVGLRWHARARFNTVQ